jgi:hypothetical protein
MRTAVALADSPVRVGVKSERFYVRMAAVCLAVGIIGFAPTYWIPLFRTGLEVPPLTHIHAVLFFGWLLFLVNQTRLAASGAVPRHRELGVAGVALATGMFFAGTGLAISSVNRFEAAGFGDAARAFSIVSLTGIVLFAVLICLAIVNAKKLEIHKRLMLVATISILQAAVGRWFLLLFAPAGAVGQLAGPPPVGVTVISGLVVDLLIVAAMIHDRRTRGQVHRVYWIAGAAVLAVQVLRVPVSKTHAWSVIAQWVLTLAP